MTEDTQKLRGFVLKHLGGFGYDGAGYEGADRPKFDLSAHDYLNFAENELESFLGETAPHNRTQRLINCVGHLKRALDCEVDAFLGLYDLLDIAKKRNLSFGQKLEFLQETEVLSSRSIARFNSVRNKMEHSFEIPKLQDIEVLFDLIAAFVAILENTTYLIATDLDVPILEEGEGGQANPVEEMGYVEVRYRRDPPAIKFKCSYYNEDDLIVERGLDDHAGFAFLFKVLVLMNKHRVFATDSYISARLGAET